MVSLGSDTDHPGDFIDAEPSSSVGVYGVRIHTTGVGGRRPGIYHTPPWLANAKGLDVAKRVRRAEAILSWTIARAPAQEGEPPNYAVDRLGAIREHGWGKQAKG